MSRKRSKPEPPTCPYCGAPAEFMASSAPLYNGRDFGPAWACKPCGAWVGCHPNSKKPLGRLADKKLRRAKMEAHAAFDPMWRRKMAKDGCSKKHARGRGYRWLANQLGLTVEQTHIGMFDIATCERVVEVCRNKDARR